tara:strand:- start:19 stop:879 length:861 start_codon:yes stop_codon:yes gene_type:complete
MDDNQRIDFYLGPELLKSDVDIKNEKDTQIEKNLSHKAYERRVIPVKNLLKSTNNSKKSFKIFFGDISHKCDYLTLVKNRCYNNENSVLLRCINSVRHWNPYYEIKDTKNFKDKIPKVIWRGTTTGDPNKAVNRFKLVSTWFNKNPNINIGFSDICQQQDFYKKYVLQKIKPEKFLEYKYILSVEGNDKDSGLNWKLNTNSLVLMAKPRVTSWLMETTLVPNYHYILLKDDFSDLEQKLKWCNNNQDKCVQIIKNAKKFMSQFSDIKKEEQIEKQVLNKYFKIIKA